MFQDEGRFGRISTPSSCWAAKGARPVVHKQIVREYTYSYAAVDPKEGEVDSWILPDMYATTMSVFLKELSNRHLKHLILLIMDGAPCHRSGDLVVPENIQIVKLPPYSPELNPSEHLWDAMREDYFRNVTFESMDDVEETMVTSLLKLEADKERIKSMTGFPWILNALPA
jgi:transposase